MRLSLAVAILAVTTIAADAETQLVFKVDQGEMVVTLADIASAEPSIDLSGTPAVTIRLNANARTRFAQFTLSNIGTQMAVILCDVELVRPKLLTAIEGGIVMLPGIDGRQVDGIVSVLRGKQTCAEGFH